MNFSYKTKKKIKRIALSVFLGILFVLSTFAIYFSDVAPISKEQLLGDISSPVADSLPFVAYFLDVGQADCSIIHTSDATVMIDAGDVDDFTKIDSTLKKLKIDSIDYLILTHAHADHIGSADNILIEYPVKNVIMPKYTKENMPTSNVYEDLLLALSKANCKVYPAKPFDHFEIGSISFDILAPMKEYNEINNTSVVTRLFYKDKIFLFQGDAEKESEQDVLESHVPLSADVLKLGHHGSKTSSTENYLAAVQPSFAVISCGKNNKYKMPHTEVLKRLDSLKIEYRRTDLDGDIVIRSDGEKLYLETENAA